MGAINDRLFGHFSARSRRQKMVLLETVFPLVPGMRILDIGGQIDDAAAQVLERLPVGCELTVANYDGQHLHPIRDRYPGVNVVQADGRALPFSDEYFDLVYSNAVIEHVGSLHDQTRLAREVMRVGKAWFVTTPNRWYPFEFHTRLPFVGWLPDRMMRTVARQWSYNHVHARYMRSSVDEGLRLMTAGELKAAFPGSRVIKCRVTVWPESLVVIGWHSPDYGAQHRSLSASAATFGS